MRLRDKVAIITGAGRGIGRATALRFAEEGARIVVADLEFDVALRVADEINSQASKQTGEPIRSVQKMQAELKSQTNGKHGSVQEAIFPAGQALPLFVNVTEMESVERMAQTAINAYGRIDILVNNAGIVRDAQLVKMSEEQFDLVTDVNLKGVFNCARVVAPYMLAQGSGVILNAASIVASYGNFGQTNYVASKAGVVGMTKVWARELGRKGIRVNAVAPGFINTRMTEGIPDKVLETIVSRIPLGRRGEPEDIANAFLWLASDEAAYVNGHILAVDGGAVI